MTRVEPLLGEIKFFEPVDTSDGHSGRSEVDILLKVVESLLDVWLSCVECSVVDLPYESDY